MNQAYFSTLTNALKKEGIGWPLLVIDKTLLTQNITLLKSRLPEGMGWRIVAKSLPAQGLIEFTAQQADTNRLMVFNLDFLQILAGQKGWDILLGKPLPAAALAFFLKHLTPQQRENLADIQFLADTPERIEQYRALAEGQGISLRINLELDVGLGRGGFRQADALTPALTALRGSNHLIFSGFMGYEPHLPHLPKEMQEGAFGEVQSRYRAALDAAKKGGWDINAITRNAGGSPTYRFYKDRSIANEIAAGSVLLKPSHFDDALLAEHVPACFIATPVLKTVPAGEQTRAFYYGGNWLADPVWPQGMEYDPLYGRSSNQESVMAPSAAGLMADDWIFFRPHQSEAVLLQFGDIAVYEDGKITGFWSVFPAAP